MITTRTTNKISRVQNLLNYLMQPDVYTVFDIDGTLGVYLFGELRHSACEDSMWEAFVKESKPYTTMIEAPYQMKDFIEQKTKLNAKSVHVCSVSKQYEIEDKGNFIVKEYPTIMHENIHFVGDKSEKIYVLNEIAKVAGGEEKVALIDDTIKTLDGIFLQSKFITVHNSVFFMYKH